VLEQEPRYREILSEQKALYDRMLDKYKGLWGNDIQEA
jgi:hypothetical protein